MILTKTPSLVQVNIGCDFYVDGEIQTDAVLLIDMGMARDMNMRSLNSGTGKGVYVEMQPQEALETAIQREALLEKLGELYTKRYMNGAYVLS